MAWTLAYKHNFSPKRYHICNNKDILYKNKSLYFDYWFETKQSDIPPATYSIIQNRRLVDSGILALNLVLQTQVGLLSDDSIKYGCQNISILKGV